MPFLCTNSTNIVLLAISIFEHGYSKLLEVIKFYCVFSTKFCNFTTCWCSNRIHDFHRFNDKQSRVFSQHHLHWKFAAFQVQQGITPLIVKHCTFMGRKIKRSWLVSSVVRFRNYNRQSVAVRATVCCGIVK